MTYVLLALLIFGASVRLTHLVTSDLITDWARSRIIRRLGPDHLVSQGIECAWCTGWWISLAVTGAAYAWHTHPWFWWTAGALTISYAIGVFAERVEA